MELGKIIRNFRKERKLTQKQLANKIQTTEAAVSQYESGRRHPDMNMVRKIAEALDKPVSTFFGEEQPIPKELEGEVDWIAFGKEMEQRDLSPEEIKTILDVVKNLQKK